MGKLSNEKDKYIAEVTLRQIQTLHSSDCLDVSFTGRRESLCLQWRGAGWLSPFSVSACWCLCRDLQRIAARASLSKLRKDQIKAIDFNITMDEIPNWKASLIMGIVGGSNKCSSH